MELPTRSHPPPPPPVQPAVEYASVQTVEYATVQKKKKTETWSSFHRVRLPDISQSLVNYCAQKFTFSSLMKMFLLYCIHSHQINTFLFMLSGLFCFCLWPLLYTKIMTMITNNNGTIIRIFAPCVMFEYRTDWSDILCFNLLKIMIA